MELQGQAALVTGAARGIGKAIALRFAQEGADIAILDLDGEAAAATAKEIEALGRRTFVVTVDVSDGDAVQAAVRDAAAHFGRLDICVNNAGIAKAQHFLEITRENWERHLHIHLFGAFYCAQQAAREMAKRKYGRIINIGSVAGLMGPIDLVPYGTAKAALHGMTRGAALDLGDYGITVNAIAPGPVVTDILKVWSPEALRDRGQHQVVGRLGAVEEIAHAALFLASPASGYVTGTVLTIDGGATGAGAYMVEKYRRRKAQAEAEAKPS
jgi:3-oxoacyl-[acyl-carrier protein] reductase